MTGAARDRGALARLAIRVDVWIRAPTPASRLAAVRVLVGAFAAIYVAARLPHLTSYANYDPNLFRPVGVVALALDRPLIPLVVHILVWATLALSIPFVLGWRFRVVGPAFAALLVWTLTYRNSWGMVFHTENLLVMQVGVLAVSRAADAWSLDARRRGVSGHGPTDTRYGWPLWTMCAVVCIAYVLAGVAKLDNAGMGWIWGDELRNHIAIDNARKALLGDIYSPLAGSLLGWDALWRALATATVAVELGAPLALLHRRIAAVWVAAAVGFHYGVLVLMMIVFPYQLAGVSFACFFRCERAVDWLRARRARRRQE